MRRSMSASAGVAISICGGIASGGHIPAAIVSVTIRGSAAKILGISSVGGRGTRALFRAAVGGRGDNGGSHASAWRWRIHGRRVGSSCSLAKHGLVVCASMGSTQGGGRLCDARCSAVVRVCVCIALGSRFGP